MGSETIWTTSGTRIGFETIVWDDWTSSKTACMNRTRTKVEGWDPVKPVQPPPSNIIIQDNLDKSGASSDSL